MGSEPTTAPPWPSLEGLPLVRPTSEAWADAALGDLDALLVDHAWCEYKAATAGLGLLARFPGEPHLIRPMLTLAREEMDHFQECVERIERRGGRLGAPPADRYVQTLRGRFAAEGKGLGALGDTLLINAFVEARSCERFRLLAESLERSGRDEELGEFYRRLADSEWRHWTTFRALAVGALDDPERVDRRIAECAGMEAEIVAELPLGPRMH